MTEIESIEVILNSREMSTRGPTLEPMREALRILRLPSHPNVVVVAGTNGKGSTSATLAHCLTCAGFKVGLFTSPHLISITERIRLNDQDIPTKTFIKLFHHIYRQLEHLPLSRFEILTLMAVRYFDGADFMILEVGVGGRFDAVNAIPHKYAIITKLGLDHIHLLGATLTDIAWNKFGVVSPGCTVVHAKLPHEALAVKEQLQVESQWIEATPVNLSVQKALLPRFEIHTKWGAAEIGLPGVRGAENTALALTMLEVLGFDPALSLQNLSSLHWPGRMELMASTPCRTYLSGDHNEQGVQSLIELLTAYEYHKLHLVVGVGAEKRNVLEPLATIPRAELYLTETPFKGRSLEDLADWQKRARFVHADPVQVLKAAQVAATAEDLIVVTGSLYLVGALRAHLKRG